jgi:hypothetical protein
MLDKTLSMLPQQAQKQKTFPKWRDANVLVKVFISQYGYNPEHPKVVSCPFKADEFVIIDSKNNKAVYIGKLNENFGDLGTYWQGDFTEFSITGEYFVKISQHRSPGSFRIQPHLWDNLIKYSAWYYYGVRRMGEDNIMGHQGDFRLVNWEHGRICSPKGDQYKYIGKSWGDGDDGRVYANSSLTIAQYCALKDSDPFWDHQDWIYSQVRWGLDGTLSFLEKDGFLKYILDAWDHQWATFDNKFYSGDEKKLVSCFDSEATGQEYDQSNIEVIATSLLLGPAYAVYLFQDRDPQFFKRVEALVVRAYAAIDLKFRPYPQKYSLGAWIWLSILLWKITKKDSYRERAIAEADRLLELQQTNFAGDDSLKARGWYRRSKYDSSNPTGEKPEQEVMLTPWIYQSIFKLIEEFPNHPKADLWRNSVRMYARDYLMVISKRNPFGFTPMKVQSLTLKRQVKASSTLAYQYFGAIGRQFHQIGNAAYMLKAGKLLMDQELIDSAWKQMFWFAGHNPSGYAFIHGFGTNINSGQYYPDHLGMAFPGGTNNGPIGDENDNPDFEKYNEYYGYGNLNLLWFATVAGASQFEHPIELWPKEISETPHTADPEHHPQHSFPLRMKGGFEYQFMAIVQNDPENMLEWMVNDVCGGSEAMGYISENGKYSAPFVTKAMQVTVTVVSVKDKSLHDQTPVTIMPAPRQVKNLNVIMNTGKVYLSWDALFENVTGYSIWKRLPVGETTVGTIFEMVGATSCDQYQYPNDVVHHYEDDVLPEGTEFMVKAYHAKFDAQYKYADDGAPFSGLSAGWMRVETPSPEKIYGFGPDSDIVIVKKYNTIQTDTSSL